MSSSFAGPASIHTGRLGQFTRHWRLAWPRHLQRFRRSAHLTPSKIWVASAAICVFGMSPTLPTGNPVEQWALVETATVPLLKSRAALRVELANQEPEVRGLAKDDPVCRLLMTMPGIGAVLALTFKSAVDDPGRFRSSKHVDPWVGPTPSRHQSEERDVIGGITKAGDLNLRRALCQAATVMLHRAGRGNSDQ